MNAQWSRSFRYLMGILLLIGFIGFIFYIREALEAIVIAGFIAYLINPAVVLLSNNTRFKRRTAVNVVYFTTIALLIAIPATITPLFFVELKGVARDLINLSNQAQLLFAKPVDFAGTSFDLRQLGTSLANLRSAFVAPVLSNAFMILESTSRGVVWFLVIIVLVYLFLSEWKSIRGWIVNLAPENSRAEVTELYSRIRAVWMAYLRGQLLLMTIVGIVFTIAWSIIGIPGALVLGVIAGLFTIVPDVGPAIAVALAVGVSLLEGSKWIPLSNGWVTLIVIIVYLVLINFKNLWLRPTIMGRMVNMHEGLIFVAILTATMLSGILGALLVVPVLASGVILVSYLLRKILGRPPFDDGSPDFQGKQPAVKHIFPVRHLKKVNRN